MARVAVLGAGIVGLAVADELVLRGHRVTVVDPSPGTGASYAAAGMLSPAGEAWHGEESLFRLGAESLALWPRYAERLGVHLHETGTVLVGLDAGDVQLVERQLGVLDLAGVGYRRLGRRDLAGLEPSLGRATGGALLPGDHSVDPRAVVAALSSRLGDAVVHGRDAEDAADVTVVATGAHLPEPYADLVRPVRGDIVRVRTDDPPAHTVRAWAHGEQVYVVPRPRGADGYAEVVVGATSEERDGPLEPTVEGVRRLLDSARRALPGLDRAYVVEAIARDRPGTPDNHPLVGPTHEPGVLLAAGTYRNGVLLAPLVARLVADHLEMGFVEPATDPRRFLDGRSSEGRKES